LNRFHKIQIDSYDFAAHAMTLLFGDMNRSKSRADITHVSLAADDSPSE